MPAYLSNELAGATTGLVSAQPVGLRPDGSVYGGRLKRLRATFTLAGQLTTDTLVIGNLPAGAQFAFGVLTASATLGTSTIAVGVTGTTGKYRAAGTFTAVDTPTMFGPAVRVAQAALTAEENVFVTIATATLPSSGTLVVDLYYSSAN
jgi:hypothetical protein